jgi:hypothetical protein
MSVDEIGLNDNRTSLVTGVSDSSKELRIDEIVLFSKVTIQFLGLLLILDLSGICSTRTAASRAFVVNVVVATVLKWICHWVASQAQTFCDTGLLIIKLSHKMNKKDKVILLLLQGK